MSSTDPRTGMIVLEADECWRLLRDADVGRLAVSIGDHVDIFPINHVVDGETVVFKTLDGTKLSGVVHGGPVALKWTTTTPGLVMPGVSSSRVERSRSAAPKTSAEPRPSRCSHGGRCRTHDGCRSASMTCPAAASTSWQSRSQPPECSRPPRSRAPDDAVPTSSPLSSAADVLREHMEGHLRSVLRRLRTWSHQGGRASTIVPTDVDRSGAKPRGRRWVCDQCGGPSDRRPERRHCLEDLLDIGGRLVG